MDSSSPLIRSDASSLKRRMRRAALCLIVLLLCGCESSQTDESMAKSYYIDRSKDLRQLGRVALAELSNSSAYPQVSTDVTEALFMSMQKQQVFGVMTVGQDNSGWRSLQENLDSLQAMRQLLTMRDTLKCNGLLVGTVTEYQPYPHMLIGLRLKLLDLTDGQLLWGMEQVWDSADQTVQKRIKAYHKRQRRIGSTSLQEELVAVSPLNFVKFVAYEVGQTFQPQGK